MVFVSVGTSVLGSIRKTSDAQSRRQTHRPKEVNVISPLIRRENRKEKEKVRTGLLLLVVTRKLVVHRRLVSLTAPFVAIAFVLANVLKAVNAISITNQFAATSKLVSATKAISVQIFMSNLRVRLRLPRLRNRKEARRKTSPHRHLRKQKAVQKLKKKRKLSRRPSRM